MKSIFHIYLSLGSNLGNRKNNIRRALQLLKDDGVVIKKISSAIETDPVGGPVQGKFLNLVAEAQTQLTPFALLLVILRIEKKLGRQRRIINGPRTIDIDILLYGQEQIRTHALVIPHPRMLTRKFVMDPLSEIAPEIVKKLKKNYENYCPSQYTQALP